MDKTKEEQIKATLRRAQELRGRIEALRNVAAEIETRAAGGHFLGFCHLQGGRYGTQITIESPYLIAAIKAAIEAEAALTEKEYQAL